MFSYFDIAILAVVVIAALIGLWRGFFKTLISFFGWFVSFLIAFFLTKPVVGALLEVEKIKNFVVGTGESFSLYKWVFEKLPDLESGGAISALFTPLKAIAETVIGGSITEKVALLIANGIFSIIVCIGLLIALRLILILFTMFANAMTANRFVGALNRLLGFVLGAVKGFAFVCVAMVILSFMMSTALLAPARADLDKSFVAKPVYETVTKLTDKFITGGKERLEKLVHITGLDRDEPKPENPEQGENTGTTTPPEQGENTGTTTPPEQGEQTTTPPEESETEQTALTYKPVYVYI